MKVIAVIPARLASTRLPRKMLREIGGQLLIARVYRAVRSSPLVDDVIVATDSPEIVEVCSQNGWRAQMTSAAHRSGTERVHEVSDIFPADVYVNVQGDEPLTRPEHIAALLEVMKNPAAQVGTLKTPCGPSDINNPNAVKVVTDGAGRALYFSRATVPYDRDGAGSCVTSSILVSMPIAKPRSTVLWRCQNRYWSEANGWSNCGFSKMESRSTWARRPMTR